MSSALERAQRAARGVYRGDEILKFMQSPKAREALIEAADRGAVPVTAISRDLVVRVGEEVLKPIAAKQLCGLVARAILSEEFVVARGSVRVRNDPVFVSGTVYRRRTQTMGAPPSQLLQRILDSLDVEEVRWAVEYLGDKLARQGR